MMNDSRDIRYFGDPEAACIFIQPVDDHDMEEMEKETAALRELSGSDDWCILTFRIRDWNLELTPWKSAPVFGTEGFGDGAPQTLQYITQELIPAFEQEHPLEDSDKHLLPGTFRNAHDASEIAGKNTFSKEDSQENDRHKEESGSSARRYILGGYSLAGFFALWAAYQTADFAAAAAVSPSVWYPGWIDYAATHQPKARAIYLSLGDREEKTRNQTMAAVGDAIRRQYAILQETGIPSTLEWNKGNHFVDNGLRMARGFAWTIQQLD